MRLSGLLVVLLAVVVTGRATAEAPKWTFVDFGYTRYDSDEDSAQNLDTEQAAFKFNNTKS